MKKTTASKNKYNSTIAACCIAYITQSIVVNFAPLLFVTFHTVYNIPLAKVTLLIAVSFVTQLIVDLLSAKIVDNLGRKPCIIFAHLISSIGFVLLGILPELFSNPFVGIVLACIMYSLGSGLIEVLASPIIDSCPSDNKQAIMSLLHSFFCWGTVLVVLLSTTFFYFFGTENWKFLACLWALIPLLNTVFFFFVPIPESLPEEKNITLTSLFKNKFFWLLALAMLCGGAAELSISQWASTIAESSLGISKTVGDLAGPCLFAVLMGIARITHSKISHKVNLTKYMFICGIICSASYFLFAFTKVPIISFIGCAAAGFACGVFWPGTFSYASERCHGGTAIFALLALAGDTGCTVGPSVVGFTADIFGENLSIGIVAASIFPIIFTILSLYFCKFDKTITNVVKKKNMK